MSFTKNPSNKNTQTNKYNLIDVLVACMSLFIFFLPSPFSCHTYV